MDLTNIQSGLDFTPPKLESPFDINSIINLDKLQKDQDGVVSAIQSLIGSDEGTINTIKDKAIETKITMSLAKSRVKMSKEKYKKVIADAKKDKTSPFNMEMLSKSCKYAGSLGLLPDQITSLLNAVKMIIELATKVALIVPTNDKDASIAATTKANLISDGKAQLANAKAQLNISKKTALDALTNCLDLCIPAPKELTDSISAIGQVDNLLNNSALSLFSI